MALSAGFLIPSFPAPRGRCRASDAVRGLRKRRGGETALMLAAAAAEIFASLQAAAAGFAHPILATEAVVLLSAIASLAPCTPSSVMGSSSGLTGAVGSCCSPMKQKLLDSGLCRQRQQQEQNQQYPPRLFPVDAHHLFLAAICASTMPAADRLYV